MNVRFTQKSREKLDAVYHYYKDLSQGMYGSKLRLRIIQKALLLKDFPLLGQEEDTLKHFGMGFRYLVEGSYKIIYRVEGNDVLIINIFDTRQDLEKMFD